MAKPSPAQPTCYSDACDLNDSQHALWLGVGLRFKVFVLFPAMFVIAAPIAGAAAEHGSTVPVGRA